MLIHHFLENSATRYPDKVALIHENTQTTYRMANMDADRMASYLVRRGVNRGDRVVMLMENSTSYVVSYYGILKAGAVAVPLSTDLKPGSLNYLLAEIEPVAIIASTRFERLLHASDLNDPKLNTLIIQDPKLDWNDKSETPIAYHQVMTGIQAAINLEINKKNLASIIYTSGSTGKPKGVMLSHGNIVANTESICQYLQLCDSDIQMVVLPFYYVMGKSLLNTIIAVGGTLVINNKFAFPATVIKQMIAEKVTIFSGVPSTYAYLLHRSPLKKGRNELIHLRLVTQAGGHMARSLKATLRNSLPEHTKICIMYGATEASARLTWLDPERFDQKMDSIGRPIPNVSVTIMDRNGAAVPQGEKGEIVAKGSNIMQGYWQNPEATATALDANGYHTGDLGWQDEDGFIFLAGRKDNLLKVGGHRINPQEVEDAILSTELAIEAAVMGLPDDLLEKRLVALVVLLNGNATAVAIMEKCSAHLPKFKIPSEIKVVRSLPKNASGKVDRKKCLELLTTD